MFKEYKISEIGEVVGGGTPSTTNDEYWNGNIPWISPKDLTGYSSIYISKGESFITKEGLNKSGTRLLPKDTVLFSSRAPIGYVALAQNPICTNQGFKSVICDESKINPLYFYYYIKANLDYMKLFGGGATFPEISGSTMRKIKINIIDDIAYQRKIAAILSTYDNLIELNNKRIKVLEQMAENLYKEWFVRFRFPGYETAEFENGIPKGWDVRKIKDIVKRLPFGELYKAEDTEKDGKVIVIDQSSDEYVGFHNNAPSHIASLENPIAIFGDHSCKYQLMTIPFSLSENVVPFQGKEGILTAYLYYLTCGIIETTEYKRHWTEFVSKKVLVAPQKLQKQFVGFVMQYSSQINNLKDMNRNLIKQRDLLLPRLMSGKLEV